MTKHLLSLLGLLFCLVSFSQIHWISPQSGIYEYQSIAQNGDKFYALFKNQLLVSSDSFKTNKAIVIPEQFFSNVTDGRLYVRDSMSFFIGCQRYCTSGIFSLDGGKSWNSTGGIDFQHFNFDQGKVSASNDYNIYRFDEFSEQWYPLNKSVSTSPKGKFQIFGDTIIRVENGHVTFQFGSNKKVANIGVTNHDNFQFFSAYEGFVCSQDSIFYTFDGASSFKYVGSVGNYIRFYTLPSPGVVVQTFYIDSVRVTTDTGRTWTKHSVPLELGAFMPSDDLVIFTRLKNSLLFNPHTKQFTDLLNRELAYDIHDIAMTDSNHAFINTSRDEGHILDLTNGKLKEVPIVAKDKYTHFHLAGFQGKQGFIYATRVGAVTNDGGETWDSISKVPSFDQVKFSKPDTLMGYYGNWNSTVYMMRSTDGGKSWDTLHKEEDHPFVEYMSCFDGKSFMINLGRDLHYYQTTSNGIIGRRLASTGIRVFLERIDDSTAVRLDISYGNSFTTDRGRSWKKLPDYSYAPFDTYSLATTATGKVLIYNSTQETISYCHLGDSVFTTEKIGVPDLHDVEIINDSTILLAGFYGRILTFNPGPEFRDPIIPQDSAVSDSSISPYISSIAISPNPASDFINLQYASDLCGGEWFLSNTSGKVLLKGTIPNTTTTQINISNLEGDIFIVVLKNGGHSAQTLFMKR